MMTLTHQVDRTVVIQATPAVVFAFLTETPRWAAWWGAGSEIDARPGGQMKIRYPDGTEVTGEVLEVRFGISARLKRADHLQQHIDGTEMGEHRGTAGDVGRGHVVGHVDDAYGGREYKGHVDSIAAATGARFSLLPPENATGNFVKVVQRVPVKIVLEPGQDPEHLLRPGLSVAPTVYTK